MSNIEHKISTHADYILVERPPDYEVAWSSQSTMLAEILKSCTAAGFDKVLIVGPSTKVKLSPIDIFALGKEIASLGLRIAVVESHDASDEDVQFLEDVVGNRGGPVQFFGDVRRAKDWLGVE